jgi:hypothetical protein
MEVLLDLLKVSIPLAIVSYAFYTTVRAFLQKDFEKKLAELRLKYSETALEHRLHAYERICLLLERISPPQLLLRIQFQDLTAGELRHILLHEIQQEFSHNLSQQLYMSIEAWEEVKKAKEGVVTLINNTAATVEQDAKALVLAKAILNNLNEYNIDPVEPALRFVKQEAQTFFA